MKTMSSIFLANLLLVCVATARGEQKTLLEPVVGHVAQDHALIWIRASEACDYEVFVGDHEPRKIHFEPGIEGCGVLKIDHLNAGSQYLVNVRAPDDAQPFALAFRTPPEEREWGSAKIGVGSCAFPRGRFQPAFDHMREAGFDAFLWLGDNMYYEPREDGGLDWHRREWMFERQFTMRSHEHTENLKPFLRSTANYSIWDDHDFGPNNTDSRFENKVASREVHMSMWANPSYGEDGEGIYFSFRRGPVEFFMLDDRWFKLTLQIPEEERIYYGEKQLAWLRARLLASAATIKIIGGGGQHLADNYTFHEGWKEAPLERAEFFEWLVANQIDGVIFVSGDIHMSELRSRENAGGARLFEMTSSGITNTLALNRMFERREEQGREWLYLTPNFCSIEVLVPEDESRRRDDGTVIFKCHDSETGEIVRETTVSLGELLLEKAETEYNEDF
ncbi:MAG: alkaline phosphatase family protein [Planctomycetes bacterium]|nr:alkaline phosphatase family protein [Planctomycetota bacterium]